MSEADPPWANLGFEEAQAVYESPSQNAGLDGELGWSVVVLSQLRAADIAKYGNNQPVADFSCLTCREDYELKSKKGRFGPKIVDGAYGLMMRRLSASDNPNLIYMNYDLNRRSVTALFVVPKQFFTPDLIESGRRSRPPRAVPAATSVSTGRRPRARCSSCANASS